MLNLVTMQFPSPKPKKNCCRVSCLRIEGKEMQNSVIQQHRVLQIFMVIAMFCAGKLYFMVIDYIKISQNLKSAWNKTEACFVHSFNLPITWKILQAVVVGVGYFTAKTSIWILVLWSWWAPFGGDPQQQKELMWKTLWMHAWVCAHAHTSNQGSLSASLLRRGLASPPVGFGRPGLALPQPSRLLAVISGRGHTNLHPCWWYCRWQVSVAGTALHSSRHKNLTFFWRLLWWTTSAGSLLLNISLEKERSCQSYSEKSKTSKNAGPWSHLGDVLIEKKFLNNPW